MGSITMVLNQVFGFTILPPLQSARMDLFPHYCYKALVGMEGEKTEILTALFHQLSLAPSAVLGCGKALCFSHLQHVLRLTHVLGSSVA